MYPHSKNKCKCKCNPCEQIIIIPPTTNPPTPPTTSDCQCCLSGLRAVLGYLKSQNASNIRIETITQQPAGNNVSIVRFYPDETNASTATLVELSNGAIVSLCQIELIQSTSLVDDSEDYVPDALKAALDLTLRSIPASCKNCCSSALQDLFGANIGNVVSNVDTNRNNVISGQNNTVLAIGANLALIDIPGNDGAALNLCFVSSVKFNTPEAE